MKKEALLIVIAETGYNVGYGAKKHLATYDIVEKMPGWVSLISAAFGIYALFVPDLDQKWIAATFILISFGVATIAHYDKEKIRYSQAGGELTAKFHQLRLLYQQVKEQSNDIDMPIFEKRHEEIQSEALKIGIPKQIFMSDWYAHYKFFWQGQIQWLDEQLNFRFFRDKMPLGAIVTSLVIFFVGLWLLLTRVPAAISELCKAVA